jgi:hypothetical protein
MGVYNLEDFSSAVLVHLMCKTPLIKQLKKQIAYKYKTLYKITELYTM